MWTKSEILKSVSRIENLGLNCSSVRGLPKNASLKQFQEAWDIDRSIIAGQCNDIMLCL
jgi:hypothetical protein